MTVFFCCVNFGEEDDIATALAAHLQQWVWGLRHGVDGIGQEVHGDMLQGSGVHHDLPCVRGDVDPELYFFGLDIRAQQLHEVVEKHGQIDIAGSWRLEHAEILERFEESLHLADFPGDSVEIDIYFLGGVFIDVVLQNRQGHLDGVQRIADFMADAGKEAADVVHHLRGLVNGGQPVPVGDVLNENRDVALISGNLIHGIAQHPVFVMDDGLPASGPAGLLQGIQVVAEQGGEAIVIVGRLERLKNFHCVAIFEENFFFRGVENDEAGIDIPQNIGENAGGVAGGAIRQGGGVVFVRQKPVIQGFYQGACTIKAEGKRALIFPMVADFEAKASGVRIFSFFLMERGDGSRLYCPMQPWCSSPSDPSEVFL